MALPTYGRSSEGCRRSAISWPAALMLGGVLTVTNVLGTAVVTIMALWVLPTGPLPVAVDELKRQNLVVLIGYLLATTPLALVLGGLKFRLRTDDPAEERRLVLLGPLRVVAVQGAFWVLAMVIFGALNAMYSLRLGFAVAETVVVGGISSCALSYLVAERILRPAAARVLAGESPEWRPVSVLVRWVLFWVLGTAVPVTGLLASAFGILMFPDLHVSTRQLALVVLVGGLGALATGLATTIGAARAVADPVSSVRRAMRRVEQGELDVSVPVYDGTEIGRLQAGFNTMAAGLRERERIRELFARQVGRDVAQATAAAEEVRLGGEVRSVGVMFVDLVGSTALAMERPPTEVVALLNRFFAVVVQVVDDSGGWVNKFEGDAALAVFGAPTEHDDPAGEALAAGRRLAARLARELPDVSAGIGVSAGEAVAGYVGAVRRFEYTVIGDPVNEAARLSELAKDAPGGLLAAGVSLGLAGAVEAARWELGDSVTLRGRTEPTRLATPVRGGMQVDAGRAAARMGIGNGAAGNGRAGGGGLPDEELAEAAGEPVGP